MHDVISHDLNKPGINVMWQQTQAVLFEPGPLYQPRSNYYEC